MLLPFMVHQFFSSLESLFYLSANSFLSNCSIWSANSFSEQLFDLGCLFFLEHNDKASATLEFIV